MKRWNIDLSIKTEIDSNQYWLENIFSVFIYIFDAIWDLSGRDFEICHLRIALKLRNNEFLI